MLDNIRNRFREGTISRELRHLAETTSLLNGVQNNFYKGLRHRRREFREFVDTRSVTPPTRDELRYYAQVALHSYQYAMLKHTVLMILPIMYPEGNIAQSLDSIFQSANAANTFFESFRKPVSRSKPHRYVPLKGLLSGTMKHLDIGGGVIPSANYLYSAVSDEDLHRIAQTHHLAMPAGNLQIGSTVDLDIQPHDMAWGLACSTPIQFDSQMKLTFTDKRLEAAMDEVNVNPACRLDTDNIFEMDAAKFNAQYRGKHNVVTTFFVMQQMTDTYSWDNWAGKVAEILPENGIWIFGGNETYESDAHSYGMYMYRKKRSGKMVPVGDVDTPLYSLGGDTESVAVVYSKGRELFENPYRLP